MWCLAAGKGAIDLLMADKKFNTADGAARACGIGIAIVGHAGWGVRVGTGSILHFIETLLNFGTTPSEKKKLVPGSMHCATPTPRWSPSPMCSPLQRGDQQVPRRLPRSKE